MVTFSSFQCCLSKIRRSDKKVNLGIFDFLIFSAGCQLVAKKATFDSSASGYQNVLIRPFFIARTDECPEHIKSDLNDILFNTDTN